MKALKEGLVLIGLWILAVGIIFTILVLMIPK
jgi:hypothetical protein